MKAVLIIFLITFSIFLGIYAYFVYRYTSLLIPLNADRGFSLIEINDGGYVICGVIYTMYSIILKVDESGKVMWSKIFDQTPSILTDITYMEGGIFALGTLTSKEIGRDGVWLVKIDEQGNVQWNKIYTHIDNSSAHGRTIAKTRDRGLLIGAVKMRNATATDLDIWLIKINEKGDVEWDMTYGDEGDDDVFAIIQAVDNGYIVLGVTEINGSEYTRIIKINDNGAVEWSRVYKYGFAHSITQSGNNGYILVGWVRHSNLKENRVKLWLARIDERGVMEWNRTYGFGAGYSVIRSSDGNYAILGNIWFNETYADADILLMKVDENGSIIWNKTYGEHGYDWGFSIIQNSDDDYIIVGETTSFDADGVDILLMKINENGTLEWFKIYSGSKFKVSFAIYNVHASMVSIIELDRETIRRLYPH